MPGGDLKYYKLNVRQRYYIPLAKGTSLFLGADLGYGEGYGATSALPFYKNYYAGGGRSVRGYRGNTLGPRESNRPLGGPIKIVTHLELFFPSPFAETERSFRLSAFLDAGNVFASESEIQKEGLRSSYGFSAIWLTPVGALTFNWGWAINAKPEDDTEIFQFSIGTPF